MSRTHILNQYLWPDGAPTAIYAEQLALALVDVGVEVVLAGGTGLYRPSSRLRPPLSLVAVNHFQGRRGRLSSVAREYASLTAAYRRYIDTQVASSDVVIISSAPPTTIALHQDLHRKGARAIYWLQDYYPELLRGLFDYPRLARAALSAIWDRELAAWDVVVKAAGNLAYQGSNATVIRNWPTLTFNEQRPAVPWTALYSGNLGYGHDVAALVEQCRLLIAQGFRLTIQGDGPGMAKLPAWLETLPPVESDEELTRSYLRSEVHLVAGHPKITGAVFPSKIWNTLASKRRLICTGFAGSMAEELKEALHCDPTQHLAEWCKLVVAMK